MDLNMMLKAVGISLCLAVLLLAHYRRVLPGRHGKLRLAALVALCTVVFCAAEALVALGKNNCPGIIENLALDKDMLVGVGFVVAGVFALFLPGGKAFFRGDRADGGVSPDNYSSVRGGFFFYVESLLILLFATWASCSLVEFSLPFPVAGAALACAALLLGLDLLRIESLDQEADVQETCGMLLAVSGFYFITRAAFPSGLQDSGAKLFAPQGHDLGTGALIVLAALFAIALWAGYYFNNQKRGNK